MATNKSELLLSGKLLNRILPFHRFLLRVILLKIHQLHRAAVLRILGTFPTVMCFQPFLKIIRPAGVQSFITAFYNVCIIHGSSAHFLYVGFVCQFLSLSFTNYRFSIVFFFTFLLFYPSAFFIIFFYSLSIQTFYYFLPLLFIASTLLFDSLPQNILLSFATTSCHNEFCDLV